MLTFEEAFPPHGAGWVLYRLEPDGTGVEEHYLGGDLADLEWAEDAAKAWLVRAEDGRDAY